MARTIFLIMYRTINLYNQVECHEKPKLLYDYVINNKKTGLMAVTWIKMS